MLPEFLGGTAVLNCFCYLKPFDLEDEQRLTCLQETVESENLLTSQLINP